MRRKHRQISPRAHEHVKPAGGKVRIRIGEVHDPTNIVLPSAILGSIEGTVIDKAKNQI